MGQSLKKLAPGSEHYKEKEIGPTIEACYDRYFGDPSNIKEYGTPTHFHRAVCETVEEINKKLNSTQFRIPETDKLEEIYSMYYRVKGSSLTKEDFQKILQEVVLHSGITGFGSKDLLLFLFGIPFATWFIKQRVAPKAIPNDIFIPGVTSATVFLLAKLNKI